LIIIPLRMQKITIHELKLNFDKYLGECFTIECIITSIKKMKNQLFGKYAVIGIKDGDYELNIYLLNEKFQEYSKTLKKTSILRYLEKSNRFIS
jgi:hypothetical protein